MRAGPQKHGIVTQIAFDDVVPATLKNVGFGGKPRPWCQYGQHLCYWCTTKRKARMHCAWGKKPGKQPMDLANPGCLLLACMTLTCSAPTNAPSVYQKLDVVIQ